MTNQTKRQARTGLQAWAAVIASLAAIMLGVDVAVVQDVLDAIGLPAAGLADVLDPASVAKLGAFVGVVATIVTRLHQALDKTSVPSLVVDPTDDQGTER
jgi:protein-disulfide isomerase-like protein with CxxC motif